MEKPTFVFVSGSWHTAEIWRGTMANLEQHGYSTLAQQLASVGVSPPHPSFDGDVVAIRACLTDLVAAGNNVVLVMHSYAGMPGNEAPVGLGKLARAARGLPGGVIRLVFVMALAMPEGYMPMANGREYPEWMRGDAETDMVTVRPADAVTVFYNDLPESEGARWARMLQPQSMGVYTSTTTYAAWRHIPSTFVVGRLDRSTITPEIVEYMIGTARAAQPTAFDVVETCDAGGHCLMISHPGWLADVLRRAADEAF